MPICQQRDTGTTQNPDRIEGCCGGLSSFEIPLQRHLRTTDNWEEFVIGKYIRGWVVVDAVEECWLKHGLRPFESLALTRSALRRMNDHLCS